MLYSDTPPTPHIHTSSHACTLSLSLLISPHHQQPSPNKGLELSVSHSNRRQIIDLTVKEAGALEILSVQMNFESSFKGRRRITMAEFQAFRQTVPKT